MLKIRSIRDDRIQNVSKHPAIGLAILSLVGAVSPGDVEDVGEVGERGELGCGVGRVGDVALDVFDGVIGVPGGARAAGDAVDLPWAAGSVGEREDLRQAVAHYPCHPHDQRYALVAAPPRN